MNTHVVKYKGITIEVNYEFSPEEPRVWNYGDGSGHPGYPAEVYITKVMHEGEDIEPIICEEYMDEIANILLKLHE